MKRTDLTGYASLLGESLASRVGMLDRLLQNAHFPSLGQYKERLLAETIRGFLPRSVDVGTGFVIFPHADLDPPGGPELHDPFNQSAYAMSRQCDILVYDSNLFPPVFKDGDFVVVRPESVRAVIEVKGSISNKEVKEILGAFHDFAIKWRQTQLFYLEKSQPTTPIPSLFAMAWQISKGRNGNPTTNPTRLRELISAYYPQHISEAETDGYPFLRHLFVHNECEISSLYGLEEVAGRYVHSFGWHSQDGRFTRVDKDGKLYRDKDRTIASLLAELHWACGREQFNRFFSRTDEVKNQFKSQGLHEDITWAWPDIAEGKVFNAAIPTRRT